MTPTLPQEKKEVEEKRGWEPARPKAGHQVAPRAQNSLVAVVGRLRALGGPQGRGELIDSEAENMSFLSQPPPHLPRGVYAGIEGG